MQRQDQLWYHAVWETKHGEPVLKPPHFDRIWEICKEREKEWQFYLDTVNGYLDHVHILIQIHPSQPVASIVGWIKGATSHGFGESFSWQSGYLIQTVGLSDLDDVRQYIRQQVELHTKHKISPNWELPM